MFNQFARYEDAFRDWRRDGLAGLNAESYKYIEFLSSPDDDQQPREGTLWPHQWEAFLRVVYAHEILGNREIGSDGFLLNIVTGGGRTAEIAEQTLNKFFKVKTLLVTEDSDEDDRRKARKLGKEQKTANPYKAVVSVLMLREGWDVPEVGVILLLRKFSSRV